MPTPTPLARLAGVLWPLWTILPAAARLVRTLRRSQTRTTMSFSLEGIDMMKRLSAVSAAVLFGILLMPTTASAVCAGNTNTNLIRDPGFESTFPPAFWTIGVSGQGDMILSDVKKSGVHSLQMGTVGSENRVSQRLSNLTPGSVYQVCFWLLGSSSSNVLGPSDFRAQWNDNDMIVLKNPTPTTEFIYYSFDVLATGNDVLSFEERNDPGFFFLDNVDVQLCTGCEVSNGSSSRKPFQNTPFSQPPAIRRVP